MNEPEIIDVEFTVIPPRQGVQIFTGKLLWRASWLAFWVCAYIYTAIMVVIELLPGA